jgi:hypothetical protein
VIRIEITCDHAEEPRARDAKHPCDSTRNRNLSVDAVGVMDDAVKAVRRVAVERGWHRWIIAALGRRQGYICGNCHRRAKGEI